MPYFVLTLDGLSTPGTASLTVPDDSAVLGIDDFELTEGVELAGRMNPNVLCPFDDELPDGRRLVDLQPNAFQVFPVSARMQAILKKEPKVEFIPIQVANHRGKVVSTEYSLANFYDPVDCVDLTKSEVVMDPFALTTAHRFDKLALDEKKIPKGRHAFRLSLRPQTVVVDQTIRDAVVEAKLTGVGLIPVEEFTSIGHLGV